jgi:hypothetical protein
VWLSGNSIVNMWILLCVHTSSTALFVGSSVKYASIFMAKLVKF